jgi:alpha-ketoglutarate-dependent taurine dioxygenase
MINYTPINQYIGIKLNHSYNEAMSFTDNELQNLLYEHKIILIKNWNDVSPTQIVNFSKKFGKIWTDDLYKRFQENVSCDDSGTPYSIYNNQLWKRLTGELPWHTDVANEPGCERYPSRLLYCTELPSHYTGLATEVSNMAFAYKELSESEKDFYSNVYFTHQSWQKVGTNLIDLPAIGVHPHTSEKFLRLNRVGSSLGWITQWYKINSDNTRTYYNIVSLEEIVTRLGEQYKYSHNWEVGDMLIFSNWATMHRKGLGTIYDDSTGARSFIRLTINPGFDVIA